jgi:hypothetical protein
MRQELFRQGRYWDTFVMAVLREEWETRRIAERSRMSPDPSK